MQRPLVYQSVASLVTLTNSQPTARQLNSTIAFRCSLRTSLTTALVTRVALYDGKHPSSTFFSRASAFGSRCQDL